MIDIENIYTSPKPFLPLYYIFYMGKPISIFYSEFYNNKVFH